MKSAAERAGAGSNVNNVFPLFGDPRASVTVIYVFSRRGGGGGRGGDPATAISRINAAGSAEGVKRNNILPVGTDPPDWGPGGVGWGWGGLVPRSAAAANFDSIRQQT